MPCYSPLEAYQAIEGGPLKFQEPRHGDWRDVTIRCGQCIGCRLERSRQWAVRCMHENQMHALSSFVTLTYSDEHLPADRSLRYKDFQLFMKRLRKAFSKKVSRRARRGGFAPLRAEAKGSGALLPSDRLRFYMCGEYGEQLGRPHFHALLFGCFFEDRELWKHSESGERLYTSKLLDSIWSRGFASVGDVTFESAAYVARYVVKKVVGRDAAEHYKSFDPETGEVYWKVPEFTRMSLKPGIGATWFAKYGAEVFPRDYVVMRGQKMLPPRYYKDLLEADRTYLEEEVSIGRLEKALRLPKEDQTRERLLVRKNVAEARLAFNKRKL